MVKKNTNVYKRIFYQPKITRLTLNLSVTQYFLMFRFYRQTDVLKKKLLQAPLSCKLYQAFVTDWNYCVMKTGSFVLEPHSELQQCYK